MKVYELLKVLHESGIKNDAYKWVDMYRKYLNMKSLGHKTSYIVAILSEEYHVCERKIYKVLSLMNKEC